MQTKSEQDAANNAKGAAQATAENLKYQSRKNAAANAKIPDKLAKYLKTQRGGSKK